MRSALPQAEQSRGSCSQDDTVTKVAVIPDVREDAGHQHLGLTILLHGSSPAPQAGICIPLKMQVSTLSHAASSMPSVHKVHRGFMGFIHKPLFVSVLSLSSLCGGTPPSSHAGEGL